MMLGPPSSAAGPSYSSRDRPVQLLADPKIEYSHHGNEPSYIVMPDAAKLASSASGSPNQHLATEWDSALKTFLRSAGLSQALKGLELDMLVMSPDCEQSRIPAALDELLRSITRLREGQITQSSPSMGSSWVAQRPLDERKLEHAHFAPGVEPRAPTAITKSISQFLAQSRARNDASNRSEFLLSLAEKRRRLNEVGDYASMGESASCARTDAKTQNRDLQMKYDIAKNEDGPLRKTLRVGTVKSTSGRPPGENSVAAFAKQAARDEPTAERFSTLDERVRNIETHLAVRYAPCPPRSLLDRLKYLEDHIIKLEREYPPWAALHFNQPNRGWPPPPRQTPIIVPPHLRSVDPSEAPLAGQNVSGSLQPASSGSSEAGPSKGKVKQGRAKSSLHRAVLEKLEVQKAMEDLAGLGKEG